MVFFALLKVHWDYYVISHLKSASGDVLTEDLCCYKQNLNHDNIIRSGKKFTTKEEGILFIQKFKDKWEYSSNDTRQENRDKKIDDILDK